MGLLLWMIFGGIVGYIATAIMGTSDQSNIIKNITIGILGAIIGGTVMSTLGETGVMSFNLYSLLVALAGAVGLITLLNMVTKTT